MAYQTISQGPSRQQRPQGRSSPGYVGFSRILDANRPGARRMADQLAGNVQQQGSQVKGTIDEKQKDFTNKVNAGTLTYTPSYNIGRGPAAAAGGGYGQAGAMSVGIQAGPNAKEYQGPKDWEGAGYDVAGLASQAVKAGDLAKGLTSMGGRAAQLKDIASGPYGAGMSSLDAALSGAALGGRGQQLASMYGNLSTQLADARKIGEGQVAGAITASNEAYKGFTDEQAMWESLQNPAPAAPAAAPPGHPIDYQMTSSPMGSTSPGTGSRPGQPSPYHRWDPVRGWVI